MTAMSYALDSANLVHLRRVAIQWLAVSKQESLQVLLQRMNGRPHEVSAHLVQNTSPSGNAILAGSANEQVVDDAALSCLKM